MATEERTKQETAEHELTEQKLDELDMAELKAEAMAEAREKDKTRMERGDFFAMMVSGFLVVGLPCLLLILIIIGVSLLLFA